MRTIKFLLLVTIFLSTYVFAASNDENYKEIKNNIIFKYKNLLPGRFLMPHKQILNTDKKVIALTFDACGGKGGSGYNKKLIDYLIKENIPATIFISGKWIDENKKTFLTLSNNKMFEIANHGFNHKVLSANGKSMYSIKGTKNIGEVVDEIELNSRKIEKLTGKKPRFYRAATGWYDEVAIKIIAELGYQYVNGNSSGFDFSSEVSAKKIYDNIKMTKKPSIIALHMNHPNWHEKEALQVFIPEMRSKGYQFVKLSDYGVIEK